MEEIDYEKLREDLIDYFGIAMMINPVVVIELTKVEKAILQDLIQIAVNSGLNLNNYIRESNSLKI